jgi:dolichol-phosphate mannosyltransferase
MQRVNRKNDPLRHRLFSPLFYKFISSFTAGTAPYQAADFRLITRRVVDVLNSLPEANRVYRVLIPALGFRSTSLTYERKSRTKGQSKYGFRQLANLGLKSLMATSGAPLRWLGITSIFGALIGLSISLIAIVDGIFVHNIPGWSSLVLLISTLFIFQSITSFVICEFLLVMLADLRQRPIYQIKAKP